MIEKQIKKNILFSSIIIFIIGSLLHFTYNFTNNNFLIGLISPVNESIFEHLKIAIYPILIWWITFYFLKAQKYHLDKSNWFRGCLVSIIVSIIVILSIYYFVTYGLEKNSLFMDIILLYIAVLIGQLIAYHIYNYSFKSNFLLSIILIFSLIISFSILTIYPPKIPLFKDNQTNTYGILKNT